MKKEVLNRSRRLRVTEIDKKKIEHHAYRIQNVLGDMAVLRWKLKNSEIVIQEEREYYNRRIDHNYSALDILKDELKAERKALVMEKKYCRQVCAENDDLNEKLEASKKTKGILQKANYELGEYNRVNTLKINRLQSNIRDNDELLSLKNNELKDLYQLHDEKIRELQSYKTNYRFMIEQRNLAGRIKLGQNIFIVIEAIVIIGLIGGYLW